MTTEFHEGDHVVYVPYHAQGSIRHKDCERGIVVGTNSKTVFVKFFNRIGTLEKHWQSCDPKSLVVEYSEYYN